MNRVVLVDNEPFTLRREQLFYINDLINDGFCVEVWDVSFFSNVGRDVPDKIDLNYVHEVNNINKLRLLLDNIEIKETCFIVECNLDRFNYPIFRELCKRECYTVKFDFYSNIIYGKQTLTLKTIGRRMLHLPSFLFNKIIDYFKWRNINYNVYLSPYNSPMVTGGINHPDYNDFVFHREPPILNYPYIVFCDMYYPLHPEEKALFGDVDPSSYYNHMKCLFDYIEKQTGLPVVIAAHPKAIYEHMEFGERVIIKYKTNNLVVNSSKVIVHKSNSISFAVLANKEILCVANSHMLNFNYLKVGFLGLQQVLGLHIHNIDDEDYSAFMFEHIEEKRRNDYIFKYLTTQETMKTENYVIIRSTIYNAHI